MLPGPLRRTRSGLYVPAPPPPAGGPFIHIASATYSFVGGVQTLTLPTTGVGGAVADNDWLVAMSKINGPGLNLAMGSGPSLPQLGSSPTSDGAEQNFLFAKKLTNADRVSGTIVTDSTAQFDRPLLVGIYRGPVSLVNKGFADVSGPNNTASLVFPAFAPHADHIGSIIMSLDQGGSMSTSVSGGPATWNMRVNGTPMVTGGYFGGYLADSTNNTANVAQTLAGYTAFDRQTGYVIEAKST